MKTALFISLSLWLPFGVVAQQPDSTGVPPVVVREVKSSKAGPYVFSQQELQQMVNMAGDPSTALVRNVRTFDRRYEGLRGTPYLFANWSKGRVALVNGQRYNNVLVKFDAFRQELVLSQPPARPDSIIIDRERVNWFVLQPSDSAAGVLFKRYPAVVSNDPGLRDSYFRVLYTGRYALLQRISKLFRPANYKEPYSPNIRYDTYIVDSAYYLLKPDGRIEKVKLSAKSLFDVLTSTDAADVPKAAESWRRQTVRTELDAIRFVEQYDSEASASTK